MRAYALTHLSDAALERDLAAVISRERAATAAVLAHIAEFDARRLYLPAGHPSMLDYCVEALHLSRYSALKRIRAARTARRFPAVFAAVAEGRLHLTAVVLLAAYLTEGNACVLLGEAAHRTKEEVEALIARRFPRTELLPLVPAHGPAEESRGEVAPGPLQREAGPTNLAPAAERAVDDTNQGSEGEGNSGNLVVARPLEPPARSRLTPHAPGRYLLQITVDQELHDLLRAAQELDSHANPSSDPAEVIKRALRVHVGRLEKRKFAASRKPRSRGCSESTNPRHIPAQVRRAVWARDGGRCTFVGANGHRCTARRFLEFDHVTPVACGGRATVAGMRLRCRAHNHLEAERAFGAEFMRAKREAARRAKAERRGGSPRRIRPGAAPETPGRAPLDRTADVLACLRSLGFRSDEARSAVDRCGSDPHATLEEHVKSALRFLAPKRGARTTSPRMVGRVAGAAAPPRYSSSVTTTLS